MIRLGYACVNLTLGRTIRSLRLATLRAQGLSYWQQLVDDVMLECKAKDLALLRLRAELAGLERNTRRP